MHTTTVPTAAYGWVLRQSRVPFGSLLRGSGPPLGARQGCRGQLCGVIPRSPFGFPFLGLF
eukprot:9235464-Pyramimonas_sp.AAC.1